MSFLFPVKNGRITQGFKRGHPGIDIAPPKPGQKGVPCLAPEEGSVAMSGYEAALEGHYVILRGKTYYWYFGHFSKRNVATGQKVKQGQTIGYLGMTGRADGIHTHMEIRPAYPPANQINPTKIKWEEENMYKGKSAKEWYSQARIWHKKADARKKEAKAWRARAESCAKNGSSIIDKYKAKIIGFIKKEN